MIDYKISRGGRLPKEVFIFLKNKVEKGEYKLRKLLNDEEAIGCLYYLFGHCGINVVWDILTCPIRCPPGCLINTLLCPITVFRLCFIGDPLRISKIL